MAFLRGILFDVYHFEETIQLWVRTEEGQAVLLRDSFQPVFYARGSPGLLRKLILRLAELQALAGPAQEAERLLFYENRPVKAFQITLARPSLLHTIRQKLYAFYGKLDLYHTDLELPTGYMYERGIYPLAPLEIEYHPESRRILHLNCQQPISDFDYSIPDFRILRLGFLKSPRLPLAVNTIQIQAGQQNLLSIPGSRPERLLEVLQKLLLSYDPDIVLTSSGDQTLMPLLFSESQKQHLPLALDRDPFAIRRKIIRKGSSYNTYGSWIYRAPSYPLFGRWHIDAANSFVYKEADLSGILELARLSRVPVQRLARSSTGAALTCMETDVALKKGYLVPWQKSKVEDPKTAYELLRFDKGGLVYVPQKTTCYENVAQIDYSQMYPTIMDIHNISPETINCECCKEGQSVPGLSYRICQKRRGVVSDTLRHILARRAYYKQQVKEITKGPPTDPDQEIQGIQAAQRSTVLPPGASSEIYEARQNSLKWMLVTSFGYLGYRNAKFGKLESHEAVTAFGREKLLTATELAEEAGFEVLHAITDCLFLAQPDHTPIATEKLAALTHSIEQTTGIAMGVDGIYSWLYFLESRTRSGLAVMNRYFGRFQDGTLKIRGIAARRSDTCAFIRQAQLQWLQIMAQADGKAALEARAGELAASYRLLENQLRTGQVAPTDLLLQRKASRNQADYSVDTPTVLGMRELGDYGVELQPGQRVRYLVLNQKHPDPSLRYMTEERLTQTMESARRSVHCDTAYYVRLLKEAFLEIRPDSDLFEKQPDLPKITFLSCL